MPLPDPRSARRWLPDVGLCLFLAVLAGTAYARVTECGFINYDDDVVITKNPRVQHGLNLADVAWAWQSTKIYWQPLTWMSFQLDSQFHGLDPVWFHRTNLLLHTLNGPLLFLLLRQLTGARWRAAVVAALFAVHPMHVESVAWATERKDVLSTFFGFLALLCYARYAQRPSRLGYLVVTGPTVLAMAAKPMLLSLPGLFLLLDYWPLHRAADRRGWLALTVEKAPWFGFSMAVAVATVIAQGQCGALSDTAALPLTWRIENALIGYATYLYLTAWPVHLAVFYPLPEFGPSLGKTAVSLGVLAGISTWVAVRRRPYQIVGWLWFLLTLVPVIGLMQAGTQALADRFVYLPHVGLFVLVVWSGAEWADQRRWGRWGLGLAAGVFLAVCFGLTWRQVGYWRDSEILWRHALAVTTDNAKAHQGLGLVLLEQHRADEAADHFREVIRIAANPPWDAYYALAEALKDQGRLTAALDSSIQARIRDPQQSSPFLQSGSILLKLGRVREAVPALTEAVRLDSADGEAHYNLGLAQERLGCTEAALDSYHKAVDLRPEVADPRAALGILLEGLGRFQEAQDQLLVVCQLEPNWAQRINARAAALLADAKGGGGLFAVRLAHLACLATANREPEFLSTYAAARAKLARGQTASSMSWQIKRAAEQNSPLPPTPSPERRGGER